MHNAFIIVGDILVNVFYLIPLSSMIQSYRSRTMPSTTPYFYSLAFFNCISWIVYAHLRNDIYVFASNGLPLLLTWFYLFACITISGHDSGFLMVNMAQFSVLAICSTFSRILWKENPIYDLATLWGTMGDVLDVLMLLSPLIDVYRIVRHDDVTRKISLPLCIMTIVNSILWGIYGVFVSQVVLVVPNIITLASGMVQFVTYVHIHTKNSLYLPT